MERGGGRIWGCFHLALGLIEGERWSLETQWKTMGKADKSCEVPWKYRPSSLGLMWPRKKGERKAVLEGKDIVWREGKKILFTVLFSEDTSRAKWQFSVLERSKLELICGLRWWDTLLCWEKDGPISAGGTAVMIHWSSESTQGRSKMMPRFQSWEKLKYFSKALVCFQHWLFKWSRLAEKPVF